MTATPSSAGAAPRVSVVVIVRDGARFVAEALESVEAQSMADWEVLVVDDGSTDATREIVGRFVARDPARFRLLRHADGRSHGMSASRNRGIAEARAALVTFLDHDDAMLPAKLERQCMLLELHPSADAVLGPNIRWHSWEKGGVDRVQDLGVPAPSEGVVLGPPSLLPNFIARTDATPQAPMVRKDAIRAVGGFEDAFRDMYEDQVFLAKLLLDRTVVVSGEVWHRYRQHDDSCVRRSHRARRHRRARRRFLRWLEARLRATPSAPEDLRAMVRREWWKSLGASMRSALRFGR